ncbi:hypothetical protein [Maritalea porphyrae]|uniref:hypothetical protein n=1 Tax=Maritalea porphyrae TaxID=880732 RepID=UPI0022B05A8C|nr:hypothetical protein [Maritalea porphyrae]MCZ4272296.1 hypothetical protein [Maritalea porphyrae]
MPKEIEKLPWYRSKKYKGNLTENQKRQLDGFRMQEKHPATDPDSLPGDVQSYINSLEFDLIELKRDSSFYGAIAATVFAIALAYYYYLGNGYFHTFVGYAFSIGLIVFAWWQHHKKNKALLEELTPSDSYDPTAEAIKREWEITYSVNTPKDT